MRRIGSLAWLPILSALGWSVLGSSAGAQEPEKTDLLEQVESRLAQLDLTVLGSREALSRLTADDLVLKIAGNPVEGLLLDVRCPSAGSGQDEPSLAGAKAPPSYLLYFDQPHLTFAGRQRALDLSRQLLPLLVSEGGRAMILSDSRELKVIEDLTDDLARLSAALDRLEQDRTQWDVTAEQEGQRVSRLVEVLNDEQNIQRAMSLARTLQREEIRRSEKSLRRLAISLGRLEDLDAPKAVLYFADTMRQRAGEHYLSFFGPRLRSTQPGLRTIEMSSEMAGMPFDALVDTAAALGVRFYTIRAEGLIVPTDPELLDSGGLGRSETVPFSARSRQDAARSTLNSLASETGGRAFVRGESGRRIAEQVSEDLSCTLLLSFDPSGLAEDAPLGVSVQSRLEGLTLQTPGRIVLRSERAQRGAKLLGAFALASVDDDPSSLSSRLVPTGFEDGRYTALLQIRVPATSLAAASWDIGASVVAGERIVQEVSGNLGIERSGVPLVLESEVSLAPGPHDLRAAAHETRTDLVLSDRGFVDWPDPNDRPATCSPVALLQQAAAAFARGDKTRSVGSLARGEFDAVDTASPIVLIVLVCRGAHQRGTLRVERTLTGSSEVGFPALDLDLGHDRCAQVQDVIPADLLGPGAYRYALRVLEKDAVLDQVSREFLALETTD